MTKKTTVHDQVEDATSRIAALKDEVRLKVHLAGMDANTLWEEELRPDLESLEGRLETLLEQGLRSAGEARVQAHLGLVEARELWEAIEPRVSETIDAIRAAAERKPGAKKGDVGRALRELFQSAREGIREATRDAQEATDANA
jgi:hypothetical protein